MYFCRINILHKIAFRKHVAPLLTLPAMRAAAENGRLTVTDGWKGAAVNTAISGDAGGERGGCCDDYCKR